jgi:regulator of replication initiation timing
MIEETETVAIRLWRDRVQLREQERNEAQTRLRIAEEKVAILMAENDRLAAENARLRALISPDADSARAETQRQMEALKGALLPLLSGAAGSVN